MIAQVKNTAKKLWNDESAQGATEYILLLVAVVAVLGIFREQIMGALREKLEAVRGQIGQFGS
jgi:Flp pilus assembly pilin Flp